ncbi:hypothetical protein [Nisaea nitritireducens]|uniref:hypothetical protein n=1 Tax=Nisaea nitritireducens TaxID=568392 RepID=UPI00186753ED|nr:hypothetical protein [Nisaea nitritireducens]
MTSDGKSARLAVLAILTALCLQFSTLHSAGAQEQQPDEPPKDVKDEDCSKIPGGNAPINILARLKGGMAVENLEFTYFKKKLYELTQEDFDYLKKLIPYCGEQNSEQIAYILDRLSVLVLEAQQTRQKSIDWIKETVEQLEKLPATKESIEEVHNIEIELKNRQLEMTRADLNYLAMKLNESRDRLYRDASTEPTGDKRQDPQIRVSPFMPEIPPEDRRPDPG